MGNRIFYCKPKVFCSIADNLINQRAGAAAILGSGNTKPVFWEQCMLREQRFYALGREEANMRVEAYNQVQQLYQTKKMSKAQQTGSVSQTDKLQISSFGKEFQSAKTAVAGAPDIREDVTAPIKAQIQNGTYSVDNAVFAEKLLSKFDELI